MAKRRRRKETAPASTVVAAKGSPVDSGQWLLGRRECLVQVLLILAAVFWIYWPALQGGFVWDDVWYIVNNPLMRNAGGLWKIWFVPGSFTEYYPLQQTVQWVQWQWWGEQTIGYHLTNIALHGVNALLVWRLLARLGIRFAWLGGLIFAVHPDQVDSVAWIVELKNTLSAPFFLLAMTCWMEYDDRRQTRDYFLALGLFIAAMLCKITMTPFPLVILLYAWWKRGRIDAATLRASLPFFAVSLVLGAMTVWADHAYNPVEHKEPATLALGLSRFINSGWVVMFYFAREFLPSDNLPAYPQWTIDPRSPIDYVPLLLMAAVFFLLWRRRSIWGRHVILGLGYFVLMLAPFLGLLRLKYMDFTWVMDHFLYLPGIGLIALVVAALGDLDAKLPATFRPGLIAITAAVILLLGLQARAYAGWFTDEATLWSNTVERYPGLWLARYNLGCALLALHRAPEALPLLETALPMKPNFADGYDSLASALNQVGRTDEATAKYREALQLNPRDTKALLNLGEMARRAGRPADAEKLYRQGLAIAPGDVSLNSNLAGLLFQSARTQEAISLYEQAIAASPDVAQLQSNLGVVLSQTGDLAHAAEHLQAAVALDPRLASAHENLGVAFARMGRLSEAIEQFETVIQLNPESVTSRDNLARALAQSGRIPEAIEQLQKVLQDHPDDAQAQQNLAKLQQYEQQHP